MFSSIITEHHQWSELIKPIGIVLARHKAQVFKIISGLIVIKYNPTYTQTGTILIGEAVLRGELSLIFCIK
jgi:hypothetical protein